MDKTKIREVILQTLEDTHDFSDTVVQYFIDNGTMREKAIKLLEEDCDVTTLSEENFNKEVNEYIAVLSERLKEILQNKDEVLQLFDNTSDLYKYTKLADVDLISNIENPVNMLIERHLENNYEDKLIALMTAVKCIDLEDENKKLTLTDEQYKTWLETDITHINTEQFEILYGINLRKQQELRSRQVDFLPSFQVDGKGKHYYNKAEVEKWLSNHKRTNPFR